jgi:serine/threonine protein kinase
VIEGLTYMHDRSIAHRDIKPENIVLTSEKVAKLCDFGWSAVV